MTVPSSIPLAATTLAGVKDKASSEQTRKNGDVNKPSQEEVNKLHQTRLKNICQNEGIDKVHHIGICIRDKNEATPLPYFFFTKQSSKSVDHPSGLRFSMSVRRLHVEVASPNHNLFQLRREDGGVILLEANQPEEVYRGDRIEMGSVIKSGAFLLTKTFLTHRAPLKQPPAPNNSNLTTSGTQTKREAYPKSRGTQDLRAAKKASKAVNKAKAKLRSGKKMTSGERRKANEVIDKASTKQCPFEKHFAHCKAKDCPFHHQNKVASCKKDFRGGEEVSAATVVKWNHQWGFVETKGGVRFFFHGTQLKFDGKDIMIGSSVKFEVKKVAQPQRLDEAINVSLN